MTEHERREFLKKAGATLAGVAGVGVLSSVSCNRQSPTRADLVKRLEKLAKSKPKNETMGGASCYVGFPVRKETVPCSKCEQTRTVGEKDEILREYNVPLKRIQNRGVKATLIVPTHCSECGFGLNEMPFQLTIKYPDQQESVQVELKSAHDIELMALFLEGKERCKEVSKYGGEFEYPLKHKHDRLVELFGVTEK